MDSLRGQFLVAMPEMGDDRFRDSVIYIIGHGEEGAMGLIINQVLEETNFAEILEELKLGEQDQIIRLPDRIRNRRVMRGGPVQTGRGFVLHSPDYYRDGNSYVVQDDICLTATLDVLKSIAFENAPAEALFALGYCGWAPGQLEAEIAGNGWLTVPFSRTLLFDLPVEARYDAALHSLGISRASLSAAAGHA